MDVASGVVGIVSLAVQLGDSIKRFCDFVESVRDAPQELLALQKKLYVVKTLLHDVRNEKVSVDTGSETVANALLECDQSLQSLLEIASTFASGLTSQSKSSRTWSALKAVQKSKKTKRLLNKLHHAISILQFAYDVASKYTDLFWLGAYILIPK